MALNPCAPLTTIILAAATTASALAGMSLGLGFALGAVIVPALVFAAGVAHFGTQVRLAPQALAWRPGKSQYHAAATAWLGYRHGMDLVLFRRNNYEFS